MQRPRIKNVFPPIPMGDGRIRIGAGDYGIAAEIEDDPQGHTWQLLGLLDGTRTRAEIAARMRAADPAVAPSDVDAAIDTLVDSGFVEDAAAELPADQFDPGELERYRRNLEFFGLYHRPDTTSADFQVRLKHANVTVLGLGGLGSYVAMSLAAIGVGRLHLVDHDVVELMNLNRQLLYLDADIGRLKAEAAAERIALINPHVRVTYANRMVDGPEAARTEVMAGRDLVVCAADRPRVLLYHWLNEAALAERTAWIRGANDGLTVNLFLHVPYETACFLCVEEEAARTHSWYRPMERYVVEELGDRTINPCTAPVAGMIGNLAALEAVKFLTGAAEPVIRNRKMSLDLQRMETQFPEGHRLPDCPACGDPRLASTAS